MAVDISYTAAMGGAVYAGRLSPSAAPVASFVGALGSVEGAVSVGAARAANAAPTWNVGAPTTVGPFLSATPYAVPLAGYATDAEGDPIIWLRTGGTAPVGVVIDSSTGVLTIPNTVPDGTYTVTIDIVDVVPVPVVVLTLDGGGADKAWTFGQVFEQGDAPANVDAVALAGTLTAQQVDVRNRWADGSVKFAVVSGVGATQVHLRAVATAPATGTVALDTLAASVTISSVVDYLGASVLAGPVTVTMPTSSTAAVFGADPSTHTAGLVRSIAGPVMTEYHYYSPVPGEPHLAVWWYVRAYSNGAREVETVVECTPWVRTTGGGRRDYTAVVNVGGTQRLSQAVVAYGHTRWSRVDWVGTAPEIKPRHDTTYLRRYAFPYNAYGTPAGATDILYGGDGSVPISGNTYASAMAPPINNPESKLDWPNHVGDAGSGGTLRTIWESAYAAGLDCYWSAEAHARTAGRWPLIVRDELTGRTFNVLRSGNTTQYQVATYTGGTFDNGPVDTAFAYTHSPPLGSGAYLLSGRYAFMEHMQMHANIMALDRTTAGTRRVGYLLDVTNANTSTTPSVRYGAWMQWGYINQSTWSPQYLGGSAPATDDAELRTALAPYIEQFSTGLVSAFKRGTTEAGIWQNSLGIISWDPGYMYSGGYAASSSAWGDNFQQNYICIALAAGLNLGLPISAQAQSDMQELVEFAATRPVAMAGTNATWNYRQYFQHLPYGADNPSDGLPWTPPTPTWYSTWLQVRTAFGDVNGYPGDTSDADGLSLFKTTDGTPMIWTPWTYWAAADIDLYSNQLQQYSCLALAVDLGVAGAAAAWARIQGSSTFQDARTASNLRNYPVTAFTPRTL